MSDRPGKDVRPTYDPLPSTNGDFGSDNLHLILPTNNPEVNLCKLLLGATLLGYPNPVLTSWGESFDSGGILGGGSHLAKVIRVLEYLNSLGPDQDEDLVLMMDAYDIWLQLPASVLLDRYHAITAEANSRMEKDLGATTVREEGLNQTVVFGSGKRCAPNQYHTVACYALDESPLPDDLYGNNTDTLMGMNFWYSAKQRYLNSGYIMGPVRHMRPIFEKAKVLIEAHPRVDPNDDGSGGSIDMYHGSDQSIFAAMFGRQAYAREKLRLAHSPRGTKPRSSHVMSVPVDNVLDPSFTHETAPDVDPVPGDPNPWEFGMHLDYWSDIGHQTVNSEPDGMWLVYGNKPTSDQIPTTRTNFDCPARPPTDVPADIRNSTSALGSVDWPAKELYTHLCLSRVPVLLHHNGDKSKRERDWPHVWYQPDARKMLEQQKATMPEAVGSYEDARRAPGVRSAGGAWSDKGEHLGWEKLCPSEWHKEIFR